MGRTEYVQSIVLLRGATHEDAVRSAARVSVLAHQACPDHDSWRTWLSGPFVKSVRRAKAGEFRTLTEHAQAADHSGSASSLAWHPTPADDLPPGVAKLQVSGTDFARTHWQPLSEHGPSLIVNESLTMTTGKTAAQVAHALFALYLGMSWHYRRRWADVGLPFSLTGATEQGFADFAPRADVRIADAGRTEVEPGSLTVLGFQGHGVGATS